MTDSYQALLDALAQRRGLGEAYYDHRGELKYFSAQARKAILQAMGVSVEDENALRAALSRANSVTPAEAGVQAFRMDSRLRPPGTEVMLGMQEQFPVRGNDADRVIETLAPCDRNCYQPPFLNSQKCWGLSIQLYTLRSNRNWGMGDFSDLCELIELAAPLGCDAIGVNPLHALFPADAQHCSPYSPSHRLFLNILYIAVDAIPEFAACVSVQELCAQVAIQSALIALRATNEVMYEQVSALKLAALRLLYEDFRCVHLAGNSSRVQAFREYVANRGEPLRLHAVFDVLNAHFRDQAIASWQQWSIEYRNPHSRSVREFAAKHEYEIEFFMYAQWLADEQLAAAQQLARDKGMHMGLYGDLAVGANPVGSEVWANQTLYVLGASVGAPPDPLALNGQDWGIPPIDPQALRLQCFAPFIELLYANMRHVAALRIDHVMSLFRLWWVPRGFGAAEGVYVHYPLDELVAQLARASVQSQCLVIGEDLGTVPDEVRHAMERYQLYHYKVLLFEKRADGALKSPAEYPHHAVATATTHDLPPLQAWWQGDDLTLRDRLRLYPTIDSARQLRDERQLDRQAVLRALSDMGLWQWQSPEPLPEFSLALARAIHLYLGASHSALVLVQLEDLIGMTDPVNVPGTHTEHANWQRKLIATTHDILTRASVCESLTALGKMRAGQNPNA